MTIWVSINGSHSSLFTAAKESDTFPTFGHQPCETRTMRADRWVREHKELARRQHAFIQYEVHKAFDDVIKDMNTTDLEPIVICRLELALAIVFHPLLADLRILRANFSVTHNGVGYEASVSYSISSTPTILQLSNLSPSEYADFV